MVGTISSKVVTAKAACTKTVLKTAYVICKDGKKVVCMTNAARSIVCDAPQTATLYDLTAPVDPAQIEAIQLEDTMIALQ